MPLDHLSRPGREERRQVDREIGRLAVPAFLALVTEPLFLLADAAVVGHLGARQLAALGLAGTVLQTTVGVCVFLAYGTTAAVARQIGAGNQRAALRQGITGLWLSVLLGLAITVPVVLTAPQLITALGGKGTVAASAADYLRIGALGMTPLLMLLAGNGVLRGLQNTRTPLLVAVGGNLANIMLNVVLVYGFDLGLVGSALGSVLAQVGSAAVLTAAVITQARHHRAPLRPDASRLAQSMRAGAPLIIRTLTLRAALVVTTYAVTRITIGDQSTNLATHQIAFTLWSFLAFALDAIAIAAQALTGRSLGAGDRDKTRRLVGRMIWWGWMGGAVAGLALVAVSPMVAHAFTNEAEVLDLLPRVLLVAAMFQPLAGVVFVLDGVLIGAGDGVYLAWGGLITLTTYAPIVLVWHPSLTAVWLVFGIGFIGVRFSILSHRARSNRWMRLGARG